MWGDILPPVPSLVWGGQLKCNSMQHCQPRYLHMNYIVINQSVALRFRPEGRFIKHPRSVMVGKLSIRVKESQVTSPGD